MKIAIIGAGAMGSLFGGLLAEAGHSICLLDIWADHVRTINESGLSIEREGRIRTVTVQATIDKEEIDPSDLVVIFVKSNHTDKAAETAKDLLADSGYVLTLQNGMGNADIIAGIVDAKKVIAGTTSHGATLLGPGRIRHAGVGPTVVGLWESADHQQVEPIITALTRAGIETEYNADIRQVVWEKLLVNVGINAITALTGIKNGQILNLAATRNLSKEAVEEAMAVAQALGISVRKDAVEHVMAIAKATATNRSSMGQDVDNYRLTEIMAINGAVVAAAAKVGMPAPVNRTLTALVETLQAHYDG